MNGEGGKNGPVLNGLKGRRERAWVLGHFSEPEKFTPGSTMPPFDDLSEPDLATLTDYVLVDSEIKEGGRGRPPPASERLWQVEDLPHWAAKRRSV